MIWNDLNDRVVGLGAGRRVDESAARHQGSRSFEHLTDLAYFVVEYAAGKISPLWPMHESDEKQEKA